MWCDITFAHMIEMSFMNSASGNPQKKTMDLKPGGLDIFAVLEDLTKICTIFDSKDLTTLFMLMKLPQFDHIWSTSAKIIISGPKICHKDALCISLKSKNILGQTAPKPISILNRWKTHKSLSHVFWNASTRSSKPAIAIGIQKAPSWIWRSSTGAPP